jgi:hypothetical protein
MVPWRKGRCATWDVAVTDTVAASYVSQSSAKAASATEAVAQRKEEKYADVTDAYFFFKTMGTMNSTGQDFTSELGPSNLSVLSEDPRETTFLFQRICVALQRYNVVCFTCSFSSSDVSANQPK